MGKTIIYEKLQDVVFGAFGKDSSGISPDEVMERINELATTDEVITDTTSDTNDSNDTNATNDNNDNTVNNDNIDDNDNNDNNDNNDGKVDDIVILSEEFKEKFGLEEFEESKILDKLKSLEDEKTALILEKEKIQRESFIKEKGITSEVFEALSGTTLKEKEQALKKVSTLTGFKLNSSNDVKKVKNDIISVF